MGTDKSMSMLILLTMLLSCLAICVKCEYINLYSNILHCFFFPLTSNAMQWNNTSDHAGTEGEDGQSLAAAGGLWRQSNGSEATMRNSQFTLILCYRRTCRHILGRCFCCGLLPGTPCYRDQEKCWEVCPRRLTDAPAPNYSQLAGQGVTHRRLGDFNFCDIC